MHDEPLPRRPTGSPSAPLPDALQPDPGRIMTQQDFGRELTLARIQAGLTVRQVARASGIPASTVGDYFAGRHLPPAARLDLLPAILAAFGANDPVQLNRWKQALARARRPPGKRPAAGAVPYRGLASFQPEDAGWFFGREELTSRLVRMATDVSAPPLPLAVVGPSGSGKSSLLRAGLIPHLARPSSQMPTGREVLLLTPGSSPLRSLAGSLRPLVAADGARAATGEEITAAIRQAPEACATLIERAGPGPAIIVDQFEETFTACQDGEERRAFIGALTALAGVSIVVLGLRADFYGHALRLRELAHCVQERQLPVGPMTGEQLRRAITEPARKAGLQIEDGLVELLLRDLLPATGATGAGHEAGALPLLSHALRATWARSHGARLTLAAYQATGGIRDAIAHTAEAAYAALDEEDRQVARRLFLSLVHVSDDSTRTRARIPLSELPGGPGLEGAAAAGVLARFVEQRLITLDSATAEITHEALLGAWPRLRGWIDADREDMRIRRFIQSAAQAWQEAGREPAALLRGGPLALARDWATTQANRARLTPLAQDFVDSGVAEERAQQSAERRRTRRLRQLVAALTVLVIVTVAFAGYAFQQRGYAFQQRRLAAAAKNVADSRTVAIEADQLRGEDPPLAADLSLAAYQIAPTSAALGSLLESSGTATAARARDSAGVVQAVALASGHRILAVGAADGTLRLWNVSRPGHPFPIGTSLTPAGDALYAVAFSPDGRLLAAAGAARTIRLWRVTPAGDAIPLGPPLSGPRNTVYSLAFSPDGRLLAAGSADKTVRLWNITDPAHPAPLGKPLTGPAGYVESVAFSPGGRLLAAGSADKTVRLWNITDPAHPAPLGKPLTAPKGIVDAVAFSPGRHLLAAGTRGGLVWVWHVTNPGHPVLAGKPLTGATDWINAVAFSPDGHLLAAASSDDRVLLWNVATGAIVATLAHPQPVTSLTWDGPAMVISGAADGLVRAWRVPPPVLLAGGSVNGVSFSPGGTALAVGGPDLQLWNPARHTLTRTAPSAGGIVNTVAFAPGGKVLAAGYGDGRIQLWHAGKRLLPLSAPRTATVTGLVEFVAFRPDGTVLASAEDDGTVRLWNVADPARPHLLATIHDSSTYVFSVAFSPDGRTLAAASADGLTRLWNVADPARPRPLGPPLRGPASYAISVAFSPDARTLAVGSADKTVRLWNVTDPAHPRLARKLTGPGGYVYSVAFSLDGTTLAAGATDGTVWLWDVARPARPTPLTTLTTTTGHIYTVAFSPGGGTLAAAGSDGSVWLWDTRARTAAAAICSMAGQPLTRAEWKAYVPGRRYRPPCPGAR